MATELRAAASPLTDRGPVIPWRTLLGGGAWVLLGSVGSNALSFLFSFVSARLLRPADYATVTACLSLMIVATVPAGTLQLVAARYTAIWWEEAPERAHALASRLGRLALALGVGLGLGVVALSGVLARYLRLPDALPLLLVAGMLICGFLGPVYRGLLQGQHHFGRFALASSGEFLVRLLLGAALVVAGWQAAGALGGVLLGSVAGAAMGWWFFRQTDTRVGPVSVPWREVMRWAGPTLLVQAALSALVFQDTLLAKHFFGPVDAGNYAGLATTGRVLVYASGALSTFLFPVVARTHRSGSQGRLVTHLSLGLVVAGAAVMLAIYATVPTLVLRLVVGSQYTSPGVSVLLKPIALALAAYAVINLLVSYLLATGNRAFWLPLLAAPLAEALLMTLFHHTLTEFVYTLDAVMLATLVVLAAIYFWPSSRVPSARQEPQ